MAEVRGKSEMRAFFARLPQDIEEKLLRGAGRAGAKVIQAEAKQNSISTEVSAAVKTRVTAKEGRIVAKVFVKGKGAFIAPWLEYGTDPHFISVDDSQRGGRGLGRINAQVREAGDASLVIGGQFVGKTVWHPGARPHPFLRPALDTKAGEAVAAAQAYIDRRVTRAGIVGAAEPAEIEG